MDRARVRNGRREAPDAGFAPAEDHLAVHFPESLAFVSKIQDTVVKKFRSALRMFLAEFRKPTAEFVTDLCHCFPPTSDSVEVVFLANAASHGPIHAD